MWVPGFLGLGGAPRPSNKEDQRRVRFRWFQGCFADQDERTYITPPGVWLGLHIDFCGPIEPPFPSKHFFTKVVHPDFASDVCTLPLEQSAEAAHSSTEVCLNLSR